MVVGYFDNKIVKSLSANDFEEGELMYRNLAVVFFYAEYCGFCSRSKADFTTFAKTTPFIKAYSVNGPEQRDVVDIVNADQVLIKGWPTILFFHAGRPIYMVPPDGKYRTHQSLREQAMKLVKYKEDSLEKVFSKEYFDRKVVKELTSDDFSGGNLNEKAFSVVFFYSTSCPHCTDAKPAFEQFVRMCAFIKAYSINGPENKLVRECINTEHGNIIRSWPSIVFFRDGKPIHHVPGDREFRTYEQLRDKAMELMIKN